MISAVGDVARPSGVVTFLFTDIVGSTRRWEADPEGMREALAAHDETLSSAIEANGGWLFKHTGDGVCAAFESPAGAVEAAVAAQRDLALPVRMGIATGEAELRGDDYFGPALNRAARVMDAGHGGQVLLAPVAASLLDEVDLLDLGPKRLRDLSEPVGLYQVRADGLRLEFPPLRTLDATVGNLRSQPTEFVGRGQELAEVAAAIALHRLVTLTGVGGVGKTRLALQAAAQLAPEFPDGVWVFELAEVGDPAAVPDAVATEMGIVQQPGRTVAESLAAALEGRMRLLVFDNCEHVLDAAADLIEAIVTTSQTVGVVATSREGLGLGFEHLWPVPSLDVSDDADSAALALFLNRADAVLPGFADGNPGKLQTVAEICRRLDGIPLAIELAASRTVSMSPEDIRDRLDDRFRLLSGARRGLERHQTLRNAVQWSYELLEEDRRLVLQRCCVFSGGFDLAAATAICDSEDFDEFTVLDLLDSLVRKSLLVVETSAGPTRYSMLETIRQFGEDRLADTGDAAVVRDVHSRYFATRMSEMLELWNGPDQPDVYEWFDAEFPNLRSAFRWAADTGDLDSACLIASGASFLGHQHAVFEPAAWAEEILPAAREAQHRDLLGLLSSAALSCIVGRTDETTAYADEGIELLGDPARNHWVNWAQSGLSMPYAYAGRFDEYLALTQRAIEEGEVENAELVLAMPLALLGRADEALPLAEQALRKAQALANPSHEADALLAAAFALREIDPNRGLEMSRRGVQVAHASGNRMAESHLSQMLAQLEAQCGEPGSALESAELAIRRTHDSGNSINLIAAVGILAVGLERLGYTEAAATIVGATISDAAARAAWPAIGEAGGRLREALGDDTFDALAGEGAAMSQSELVRFALAQIDTARSDLQSPVSTASAGAELTSRQLEVAQLVARGLSNKDIAKKLDVSPYTVETHVRNILERLDATNRAQIVAWVKDNEPTSGK